MQDGSLTLSSPGECCAWEVWDYETGWIFSVNYVVLSAFDASCSESRASLI